MQFVFGKKKMLPYDQAELLRKVAMEAWTYWTVSCDGKQVTREAKHPDPGTTLAGVLPSSYRWEQWVSLGFLIEQLESSNGYLKERESPV